MSIVVVVKCEPRPPRVWDGRCRHCNSLLECFAEDLDFVPPPLIRLPGDPPGDRYRSDSFRVMTHGTCPVCRHQVEFMETDRTELKPPDPAFVPPKPRKPKGKKK